MDNAHLAVVHFVGYWGTAGAKYTAVEIALVHTKHHATHILVVMLALPHAGIGALLDEGLEDISPPAP